MLWIEMALFIYTLTGFILLAAAGEWAALPFQAMFAGGFGMIVFETLRTRDRFPFRA